MATKHVLQCNFQTCDHWIFHANYGETLFLIADQWGHYIKKQENIDYWRTCESGLVKNHLTIINFSSNRGLQKPQLNAKSDQKGFCIAQAYVNLYVCKYVCNAWMMQPTVSGLHLHAEAIKVWCFKMKACSYQ